MLNVPYKQKLSDLFCVTDLKRIKAINNRFNVEARELSKTEDYIEDSYGKEFKIDWKKPS